MEKKIDIKKFVNTVDFYWAHPKVSAHLTDHESERLVEQEFISWMSDLYWGEFIAALHAQNMCEYVEESKRKQWELIYNDEIKHHAMIANWMNCNGIKPAKMNLVLERALEAILGFRKNKNLKELEVSLRSQIFFEELIKLLVENRICDVLDSELKNIFEILYKDEKYHISSGVQQYAMHFSQEKINPKLLLKKSERLLFPIHFARAIIEKEKFSKILKLVPEIVSEKVALL
jgi:rubrerythrin